MKRFVFLWILAASALIACSENDGPGEPKPENRPVWEEFTHAELLKLSGAVKHIARTRIINEELQTTLLAAFDPKGNCTAYNATGIEPETTFQGKTRSDWGVEAVWYTYTYDASGRMATATKYEVGSDPVVFTISYGSHSTYIPTPFPLGEIAPFMLKGVTQIQAADYELVSDGATASATRTIGGWRPSIEKTTFTFNDGLPVKQIVSSYPKDSNEELERTQISYTYERKWVVGTDEVKTYPGGDESENQRIAIQFSHQWPCTVIAKEGYVGTATTPEFRMEYTYAENGLPFKAAYTVGMFYDSEFSQHYTAYDHAGNWTAGVRTENGEQITIKQTPTYY